MLAQHHLRHPIPVSNNQSPPLYIAHSHFQLGQGLRYENNVVKQLKLCGFDLEHNPWFMTNNGPKCPDIVVYELCKNRAIVIEVKLTYTPVALVKLEAIYCPIIKSITNLDVFPLVITKNVTRVINNSSFPNFYFTSFYEALKSPHPIYQYLGRGPII